MQQRAGKKVAIYFAGSQRSGWAEFYKNNLPEDQFKFFDPATFDPKINGERTKSPEEWEEWFQTCLRETDICVVCLEKSNPGMYGALRNVIEMKLVGVKEIKIIRVWRDDRSTWDPNRVKYLGIGFGSYPDYTVQGEEAGLSCLKSTAKQL